MNSFHSSYKSSDRQTEIPRPVTSVIMYRSVHRTLSVTITTWFFLQLPYSVDSPLIHRDRRQRSVFFCDHCYKITVDCYKDSSSRVSAIFTSCFTENIHAASFAEHYSCLWSLLNCSSISSFPILRSTSQKTSGEPVSLHITEKFNKHNVLLTLCSSIPTFTLDLPSSSVPLHRQSSPFQVDAIRDSIDTSTILTISPVNKDSTLFASPRSSCLWRFTIISLRLFHQIQPLWTDDTFLSVRFLLLCFLLFLFLLFHLISFLSPLTRYLSHSTSSFCSPSICCPEDHHARCGSPSSWRGAGILCQSVSLKKFSGPFPDCCVRKYSVPFTICYTRVLISCEILVPCLVSLSLLPLCSLPHSESIIFFRVFTWTIPRRQRSIMNRTSQESWFPVPTCSCSFFVWLLSSK